MAKIFTFEIEEETICVDLDTVKMITFREDGIRITFKDCDEISEFNFYDDDEDVKNRLKEDAKKLINFWKN